MKKGDCKIEHISAYDSKRLCKVELNGRITMDDFGFKDKKKGFLHFYKEPEFRPLHFKIYQDITLDAIDNMSNEEIGQIFRDLSNKLKQHIKENGG